MFKQKAQNIRQFARIVKMPDEDPKNLGVNPPLHHGRLLGNHEPVCIS